MPRTAEAMELRRAKKFDDHGITVVQEAHTDHRESTRTVTTEEGKTKKETYTIPFHFTHAVYAGKQLIGRQSSRRSALKRAHKWIRDHRKG